MIVHLIQYNVIVSMIVLNGSALCCGAALGKALSVVPSISHSLGDIMLQGVATGQLAPAQDGQSQ